MGHRRPSGGRTFSPRACSRKKTNKNVCVRHIGFHHLTVAVGDGGGVALALALLHGGGSEGLGAIVRRLPGVRQTLHRPHLLAKATLRRALQQKNTKLRVIARAGADEGRGPLFP